ncbi:hypothetical protein BN970_03322 [Mycolicibacterium conceptionense]|uniref:Uncharacterized protein n=1 Tax=Mycolicibacterium conceptionense TaxID=451644 RepID=A0A0U1DID0_9MYCO|nr:hypothetical protein BN970_03322 [Mycolicibacterium conceptionense]
MSCKPFDEPWTIRERIAHHIHQLAYKFSPPEEHIATVYDAPAPHSARSHSLAAS